MSISVIAGLGNPGREYDGTRHNIGFALVDALATAGGLAWKNEPRFEARVARWPRAGGATVLLVKPQTFMNDSGRSLRKLLDFHKLPAGALAVVYDDLTIDAGLVKVTVRGSAGGHNGVASLLEHLGGGFARFRVGIASARPAGMDIKDFVLGKFSEPESTLIHQQFPSMLDGLRLLLERGPAAAMNTLNRRITP
jgi:PTH1 family peptidyl-tRNA hydrolase